VRLVEGGRRERLARWVAASRSATRHRACTASLRPRLALSLAVVGGIVVVRAAAGTDALGIKQAVAGGGPVPAWGA
jgi:hypothetical protein